MNTEIGVKYVKDERYIDFSEFRMYKMFGRYMNVLISKFLEQYAWSRNPSQLSLKIMKSKYIRILELLKNLILLVKRLNSK